MKHIEKFGKNEPNALIQYKKTPNATFLGYGDKDIENGIDKPLKKTIGAEQGWICCYCNQRIGVENMTVEHYIPQKHHETSPFSQEKHTEMSLDYLNLLGSCKCAERDCSELRGNIFLQHINPLSKNCEKMVAYRKKVINGKVLGYEIYALEGKYQTEIQHEIDVILKLNTEVLCQAREAAITKMKTQLHSENAKKWSNDFLLAEMQKIAKMHIINTQKDKGFSPFCMTVIFYLNKLCKK